MKKEKEEGEARRRKRSKRKTKEESGGWQPGEKRKVERIRVLFGKQKRKLRKTNKKFFYILTKLP